LRQKRLIGIVGGLGPSATIFYYREAHRLCLEACGHRPRLLLYNIPLEEMCTAAKRGDLEAMAGLVAGALRSLAAGGAEVALVSANTPHLARRLYTPVAERLGLRLVDIVEASAAALARQGARRVGLLATTATLRSRLYHRVLEGMGLEVAEPPPRLQEALDAAIAEGFATGSPGPGAVEALRAATRSLAAAGVDAVLIACTDLSPHRRLVEEEAGGASVVDSALEQLREAIAASTG